MNTLIAVLAIVAFQFTKAFDTKLPYTELMRCKEYRCKGKYDYRQVFEIPKMSNNMPEYGELFRLKFYVLASNGKDAWILFRTKDNKEIDQSEIAFGLFEHNNTVSSIYDYGVGHVSTRNNYEALSPLYPAEIHIIYDYSGTLTVILKDFNKNTPLLQYKSGAFKLFTRFQFSSYNNEVRWFYDCPKDLEKKIDSDDGNDGSNENITTESVQ
ncbi:hypothetical protein ACFFRR_001884 [Megaselia abdita]